MKFKAIVLIGLAVMLALGQTSAPRAAQKPASQVDNVIQLVKAGMSEGLIIKTLQKQNKPMDLTPADLVKLKNAGVSENIIGVMMDPSSAPAAAPAAAPAEAAPQAAPAPVPQAAPPAEANPPAAAPAPTGPPTQAQKKRVMIDEFDYSAVMNSVQAVFGTNQNIGKGIRAMLVTRLSQQGNVVVIERAKINTLMAEQDRNVGGRVKAGSGARVGNISGADGLLAGDIVIFGRDDKHTRVAGGGIIGRGIGAIASSKDEDKAVVAIDYRFVDAETSEVIASGEARGESSRKSKGLGGMAGALGKGVGGVGVDMTSSNFASTIIGEATQDCVNKLADILLAQTATMRKSDRPVETTVADVAGNVLTLAAGSAAGVNVGDVFEILRVVRTVKDPATGEVLDQITEKSGELTITNVRDRISIGSFVGSQPQVGYLARKRVAAQ
ncbi:MAG: CsgG/HfaB family protein [Bryobacteraceae bacterium]|jgi:curli biogenesis system outer membrane secretion channel CsgG